MTSAFSVLAGGVNAASGSADGQGVVTSGTAATFAALAVGRQAAGSSAMTAAFVAPTEMLTPLSQPAVAGGRTIIFDEQATPAPDDELLADLLVTSNP